MVDKPAGPTSHDVVGRARKAFGQRRVGHAGTLDPGATGVLVLGLGRATRLLRFLADRPKSYACEVVVGVETTTLDDGGEVMARHDMSGVTLADVRRAASLLVGEIDQVPPMVSAVKVGGRRLHALARAGVEVERSPRRVTVTRLDVSATAAPDVFAMEVDCSSGTYVRVLAADLGTSLGGGAHVRRLRRTAVGPFTVDEAVSLDELGPGHVLPPVAALQGYATVVVPSDLAEAVGHGAVLDRAVLVGAAGSGEEGDGPWAVVDAGDRLLAVYEHHAGGKVKPAVVMSG